MEHQDEQIEVGSPMHEAAPPDGLRAAADLQLVFVFQMEVESCNIAG